MNIIHKIIEWDKKRKFGSRFFDFILLLCIYLAINMTIMCVTKRINIPIIVITIFLYEILVNRSLPD